MNFYYQWEYMNLLLSLHGGTYREVLFYAKAKFLWVLQHCKVASSILRDLWSFRWMRKMLGLAALRRHVNCSKIYFLKRQSSRSTIEIRSVCLSDWQIDSLVTPKFLCQPPLTLPRNCFTFDTQNKIRSRDNLSTKFFKCRINRKKYLALRLGR